MLSKTNFTRLHNEIHTNSPIADLRQTKSDKFRKLKKKVGKQSRQLMAFLIASMLPSRWQRHADCAKNRKWATKWVTRHMLAITRGGKHFSSPQPSCLALALLQQAVPCNLPHQAARKTKELLHLEAQSHAADTRTEKEPALLALGTPAQRLDTSVEFAARRSSASGHGSQ